MASIRLAYVGGGSTRAPGTVASLLEQGKNFQGSELVLIDLDKNRLELVKTVGEKLALAKGIDVQISVTTDRRAGLTDCDAVLTSFRPGGFEMRHLDESIPMKYGVIGQETQGPGGFFMALRSIQVMKGIVADLAQVSPKAIIFNYTNPINIVSQAVTRHTDATIYSLCEGPILSAQQVAVAADLEPDKVTATTIGLNHASWSIKHDYDGQALIPLLQSAYQRKRQDASVDVHTRRLLQVAATMESIPPADYFQYYLFKDEVFEEMARKPTTRAQDIMASVPGYWDHYTEQAQQALPQLDPKRSRGGIFELELALDLINAVFNDTKEVLPVNLPNRGAIQDLPDDCVVEAPAYAERRGVTLLTVGQLPRPVAGLIKMLAEYQSLAADAAWYGTRKDAIRALSANPLVASLDKAEAIYDELAAAQSDYLPERLLH